MSELKVWKAFAVTCRSRIQKISLKLTNILQFMDRLTATLMAPS